MKLWVIQSELGFWTGCGWSYTKRSVQRWFGQGEMQAKVERMRAEGLTAMVKQARR